MKNPNARHEHTVTASSLARSRGVGGTTSACRRWRARCNAARRADGALVLRHCLPRRAAALLVRGLGGAVCGVCVWFFAWLGLFFIWPGSATAVYMFLHSKEFSIAALGIVASLLPPCIAWMYTTLAARDLEVKIAARAAAATLAARDAAAAATLAARDASAAKEREQNAAARKADMDEIKALISDSSKVWAHKMRSLAAGVMRVPGGVTPAPALAWSAAEVGAWFASSARWAQYQRHFAAYDGEALLTLTNEAAERRRRAADAHRGAAGGPYGAAVRRRVRASVRAPFGRTDLTNDDE